jgi:uncharacterized protein (DUF488 family)
MSNKLKQNVLYTSGYEGLDLDQFVSVLKENNIEFLIDIREKAISRKKGFSKTALEEKLIAENIIYLHYKDLGSPGEIRKKLREDGDYSYFFEQFSSYLSSKEKELKEVTEIIKKSICCLLCFEKDHEKCHRKIVAKEVMSINNQGMLLKHL